MKDLEGVEYIPGGATQNSIRVCQMMLDNADKKEQTHFIGCVGDDKEGETMRDLCKKEGVTTHYLVDKDTPTGVCAVGVLDKERTLCTKLEAANNYKLDHFNAPEQQAVLDKVGIVYSSGFHFTVCPDAMLQAAKHCTENDKTYCLNLAAPFIMEVPPFWAAMKSVLPYTDIVFGNESEALVFAKVSEWDETDIKEIAKKIQALPKEGGKARMVCITQGNLPTVVADADGVTEYKVDLIEDDKIVETNGAGDAFAGGLPFVHMSSVLSASNMPESSGPGLMPKQSVPATETCIQGLMDESLTAPEQSEEPETNDGPGEGDVGDAEPDTAPLSKSESKKLAKALCRNTTFQKILPSVEKE
eukprot:gene229-806_t